MSTRLARSFLQEPTLDSITSNQILKKGEGDVTGIQPLEGVAGKEELDFFQGGCNCLIKHALKSQIFNNKNIFLCHNKKFKQGNFTW